jgi:hypothetical protein
MRASRPAGRAATCRGPRGDRRSARCAPRAGRRSCGARSRTGLPSPGGPPSASRRDRGPTDRFDGPGPPGALRRAVAVVVVVGFSLLLAGTAVGRTWEAPAVTVAAERAPQSCEPAPSERSRPDPDATADLGRRSRERRAGRRHGGGPTAEPPRPPALRPRRSPTTRPGRSRPRSVGRRPCSSRSAAVVGCEPWDRGRRSRRRAATRG